MNPAVVSAANSDEVFQRILSTSTYRDSVMNFQPSGLTAFSPVFVGIGAPPLVPKPDLME